MNECNTIGLDTAKNVFHLVVCNHTGKLIKRKRLRRAQLLTYFSTLPRSLVGLEACSGSHYWAREISKLGHHVKLIAAQHVKPYLTGNKHDFNDALAIAEAVVRPQMRFVRPKTIEQQDQALLNHKRQQVISARTQHCNRIRAMLSERGIVISKGLAPLRRALPVVLENQDQRLSAVFLELLQYDYDWLIQLDTRLSVYDQQLSVMNAMSKACQRLMTIPGFGPVLSSYFSSEIGDGRQFTKGRDVSASLGIVPAQHSSGGRQTLLGISKRGNSRLRCLLIHGARAVVSTIKDKQDPLSCWLRQLIHRVGIHKATVAYANKMARMAWRVLRDKTDYNPCYAAQIRTTR